MNIFVFDAFFLLGTVDIGSKSHILPILITLIFSVVLITYSKRRLSIRQQHNVLHILGCFISLTIIGFQYYIIATRPYDVSKDLPLFLCSVMGLFMPLFTYSRAYWMYEILLFWIIAGTIQGVITPDITNAYPSFEFFRYWILHLGLLLVIFYATFVFDMRPKFTSVFKSFVALQVYIVVIILINYALDANYCYLNEKPKSASLLDYFGDWPWYILVCQIIVIPYFLLIYLPFYLSERKKNDYLANS